MTKNEVIRGLLEIITADGTPEKRKKVLSEAVALLSEEKEKEYITVSPAVITTPITTPYYPTTTPYKPWDNITWTCNTNDPNRRTTL